MSILGLNLLQQACHHFILSQTSVLTLLYCIIIEVHFEIRLVLRDLLNLDSYSLVLIHCRASSDDSDASDHMPYIPGYHTVLA